MSTRRNVLKLFGVAPLAVKTAGDKAIAKLSGVETNGFGEPCPPASHPDHVGLSDHIKLFGFPQIVLDGAKDRAQVVYSLDPDIACKKTWSMSVKIITQRQRNYETELRRYRERGEIERKIKLWEKLSGIKFSW